MRARSIYKNVRGLDFNIGQRVKILASKKIGVIKYFMYIYSQSYPKDPMIGVAFKNGEQVAVWKEELKKVY